MNASNAHKRLAILALLLACLALAGCSGSALYSNLEEQQANQVMAALLGAGIKADKNLSADKKGWEVRIAESDFPRAMDVLHARGLPRRQSFTMGEIFKKEGFATSATQEKALYVFGLEESMRQKLLKIDGVVDAAVSIALPDRNPLGDNKAKSSASVFIYQDPGTDLRDRETDLKVGVKDSIEGLDDLDQVTIKFFTVGATAPRQAAADAPGGMPAVLSSISPLTVAITLGVAVLLALAIAFGSRARARLAQAKQPQRVWNG
ncbi:MAG TPA: type III secretion inner membrane ring lipoprotein SctJ [Luteimonas sp.]|nr:type III secretion inner membrane ring lipoprotein SctJ [Luteimonas sp.]